RASLSRKPCDKNAITAVTVSLMARCFSPKAFWMMTPARICVGVCTDVRLRSMNVAQRFVKNPFQTALEAFRNMVGVMPRRLVKRAARRTVTQDLIDCPRAHVRRVLVLRCSFQIYRLVGSEGLRIAFHDGQWIIVHPALPDFVAEFVVLIVKPVKFTGM